MKILVVELDMRPSGHCWLSKSLHMQSKICNKSRVPSSGRYKVAVINGNACSSINYNRQWFYQCLQRFDLIPIDSTWALGQMRDLDTQIIQFWSTQPLLLCLPCEFDFGASKIANCWWSGPSLGFWPYTWESEEVYNLLQLLTSWPPTPGIDLCNRFGKICYCCS